MTTQYQPKPFVINLNDLVYLLAQVNFVPLFDGPANSNGIVAFDPVTMDAWDAKGNMIWDAGTQSGSYQGTGLTSANVALLGQGFPQVSSPIGIRDVSGLHNNLFGSQADWGAVDVPFRRDIAADFTSYVTNSDGLGGTAVYIPGANVTDYMPRIISQTITTAGVNLLKDGTGHYVEWDHVLYESTTMEGNAYKALIDAAGVDTSQNLDGSYVKLVDGAKIVAPGDWAIAWDPNVYNASLVYRVALVQQATFFETYLNGDGKLYGSNTGGPLTDGGSVWAQLNGTTYVPLMINDGTGPQPLVFSAELFSYKTLVSNAVTSTSGLVTGQMITVTDQDIADTSAALALTGAVDPAAIDAMLTADTGYGLLETLGHIDFQNPTSGEFFIGSENPGVAPVNSWFAIFGQFFDHGLDKIGSGGNGKITIQLETTDPLYRAPGTNGPLDQGNTKITVTRATIAGTDANGDPNYVNHTSPFIDQSQTYGSVDQITQLLRKWVPNSSTASTTDFKAAMELFDGSTLADTWTRRWPDGTTTEVRDTLPTLNELREHVLDTGRDALTWEDVSNYRNRDASGDVSTGNSGHALILDMNPRFDLAHLNPDDSRADTDWDGLVTGKVSQAIIDLNLTGVRNFGAADADVLGFTGGQLSLRLGTDLSIGPGPVILADTVLTGATALIAAGWVNPADFSIIPTDATVHAAVGEILMAAVGDHYIAGDGRVNENFGLTSIHHVFHEEHNFQIENLKSWIYQHDANNSPADHAGLHAWQEDTVSNGGTGSIDAQGNYLYADGSIAWDADKMFNATKLIVEMEYQHAAVDQYARTITPRIQEFVGYSSGVDSTISLEFSQVAFRFGHSTIRETIDTIDPSGWMLGNVTKYALEKAFLTPQTFADEGVAAITLGLARQQMNEVDEFITPALTQGLLDLPLDLAAINIARGRDLGIPTLNDFREGISLARYTSWDDYGKNMIHPESLVNFIAAYSFGGDVAKAGAIMGLYDGTLADGDADALGYSAADALAFMLNNTTVNIELNTARDGFNHIDSWIGGLAEAHVPGGLLGETFDAVFVAQIQSLMDGDRFYYLYRLFGTNLHEEVNNGQFKDIVERNTGLEHLNGSIFAYADKYYEFGRAADGTFTGTGDDLGNHFYMDTLAANPTLGIFTDGGASTALNGTTISVIGSDFIRPDVTNSYIRDVRPELDPTQVHTVEGTPTSGADSHEVIVATDNADYIHGRAGDDTLYGEGGNDFLFGDGGVDRLYGGEGHDMIDTGEGPDLADGGGGKDIIYGRGSGAEVGGFDQLVGGLGNDLIIGGEGIDKLSGGSGDDIIYGDGLTNPEMGNTDAFTHGGDGNDYIDTGASGDLLYGEEGDDYMVGGIDQDLIQGGTGDDILRPGTPSQAINGGPDEVIGDDGYTNTGFDLIDFSDYVGGAPGIVADMDTQFNPLAAIDGTTPFPAWFQMEGVIGSQNNDTFIGSDVLNPAEQPNLFGGSNWLIGGSGDDTFTGRGGNDVIIGGSIRLDTLIGQYAGADNGNLVLGSTAWLAEAMATGTGGTGYDNNTEDAYTGASNRATGSLGDGLLGNATLGTDIFDLHFTEMLRSRMFKDVKLGDGGEDGTGDVARFSGNRADYTVEVVTLTVGLESVTAFLVSDNRDPLAVDVNGALIPTDGTDLVTGVENFTFADGTFDGLSVFNVPPVISTNGGAPVTLAAINENTAANTQVLQITVNDINATDPFDPLYPQTLQWSLSGGTAGLFQIDNAGNITLASAPNYEALAIAGQTQQVLTATVSDGTFSDTIEITLNIANVDEAPIGAPIISGYTITNGGERATLTGSSTLIDPDLVSVTNATGAITGGYQWQRLQGVNWVNINGATNAALTNQENTTVRLTQSYTDVGGQKVVVSSETAVITANGGNNTRVGTSGNDIILGLDGNDVLTGGLGNDIVNGGDNNDRIVATAGDGNDSYIGGAGTDTYDLSGTAADATVNLVNGTASSADTGTDTLSGIENVIGSNGVNTITGTSSGNRIEGRGGNDVINGGGGADTLLGGAGDDHIRGGTGADVIIGGAGADRIDLGNPVDTNRDVVRLTATGDYGDEVFDFRSTGTSGQRDVMSLSASLNTRFDDAFNNNNSLQFASGNASAQLQIDIAGFGRGTLS